MAADETRVTSIKQFSTQMPESVEAWLVQISGPQIGKKFVVEGDDFTIGRDEGNDVCVDLDNVSRRHARLTSRDGATYVTDLGSTNGTFINEREVIGEAVIRTGDLLHVGGSIFKFLAGDDIEKGYHETIYSLTIQDGLTQIHNKRYFLEFLEREMPRAHRFRRPLSLMMFDIDFFKKINDQHGHLAGDYVLRELASLVKTRVRREECFARYGGEEFAIVMPEAGLDNARVFAERLRRMIEEKRFVFEDEIIPVTISIGLAELEPHHGDALAFIKDTDANLYKAKHAGRNRVVGP